VASKKISFFISQVPEAFIELNSIDWYFLSRGPKQILSLFFGLHVLISRYASDVYNFHLVCLNSLIDLSRV
jgi:hypothetical protein